MSENSMATNVERESADHVPEESTEPVLSMVDVLEEENQLEDDANAVLGGSDDTNCTYPQGYIHRQALYACATCCAGETDSHRAGVCLACSLECHDGHHLYELYTKRSFRCDCGNGKFPNGFKCKLVADKCSINIDNKYNHNFTGLYCSCSRPYPDPEDEVEDEMIQCVVCEDWFHGRHLGTKVLDVDDYDEMICGRCMKSCDFLWPYAVQSVKVQITKPEINETVDVESAFLMSNDEQAAGMTGGTGLSNVVQGIVNSENGNEQTARPEDERKLAENGNENVQTAPSEDKTSMHELGKLKGDSLSQVQAVECIVAEPAKREVQQSSSSPSGMSDEAKECYLDELKQNDFSVHDGATFWKSGWRSKLCRCDRCKQMYLEKEVSFLTDESDTISAYENRGKDKRSGGTSRYDAGMHELSKMHRMQQVDLLHGYNDMKSELTQYLRKFAENGKVVREEDIKEFFSQMEARKKQRVSVPFHCR